MDDTDRSSEASGNSNESGRAHELKLEIEALRIQLEIEKLKSSRVLQDAAQARSESSGIGKYAKELRAVLAPMPTNDIMIPAWFKNADSLLRTLQIPEEMQGALILPFLSDTALLIADRLKQLMPPDIRSFVTQGEMKGWLQAKDLAELAANFEESMSHKTTMKVCLAVDESGRDLESDAGSSFALPPCTRAIEGHHLGPPPPTNFHP
ncbi:hypothetical protein HPB49_008158 [Dermacentor silvarum]|uniref:Uncharacterized protein n=1 Tax=Dermacentor silvarum TaxID=543639 RepID=A0ACB8D3V4_DERSI|nr:hypothetical protein HPB49_008158 [Dermacentor silvarum]